MGIKFCNLQSQLACELPRQRGFELIKFCFKLKLQIQTTNSTFKLSNRVIYMPFTFKWTLLLQFIFANKDEWHV